MTGRQLHRAGTTVLSLAMVAIGIALIVEALIGEDVLSIRVLLGLLFVVAGTGRIYVDVRRGRGA
ncbi:MAG: hypothetical protein WBV77_07975 [Solirubrobacteraceae bacterium]|jgi:hypothetical protein